MSSSTKATTAKASTTTTPAPAPAPAPAPVAAAAAAPAKSRPAAISTAPPPTISAKSRMRTSPALSSSTPPTPPTTITAPPPPPTQQQQQQQQPAVSESDERGGGDSDGDVPPPRERGWLPVDDGRFRVALMHRFAESDSEKDSGGAAAASSSAAAAAVHAAPDPELQQEEEEEEACSTPTGGAMCNRCQPTEPRVEVSLAASVVNALTSAYTSTGYPLVVTSGNARGAVYGSFLDLTNPTLSSIELPPARTIVVAPSFSSGSGTAATAAADESAMDTLLAIHWSRGDRIMTTAGAAATAAAAAAQAKQTPPSSNTNAAAAAAAAGAGSHTTAVARTIAHHLLQFPEGIHGIHSSPALRQVLVDGALPTTLATAPAAPPNTSAHAPATGSGGVGSQRTSTATAAAASEEASTAAASTAAASTAANAEANVPPLPTPPTSSAPVQHTLVSASTFNHVSVYVAAHQDGVILYTAPLASLSASIATRKVTAHQLILVAREEVEALAADPRAPLPTQPPPRTHLSFTDVRLTGPEARVIFDAQPSRFIGADARRRTVAAAPVRITVEPHLLLGNQNGDLFIYSLLQERIVQHMNYSAGSANVTPSIAGGSNSGVGSKLICAPVSCIAEVENGVEKKITSMVEYAMVAKRNGRRSFNCDDTPASFSAVSGASPTHYYYPVPPSIYAVGFDNGQVLLVCVTCEGGWMLRHLSSHRFGVRPIHAIAVRVPPFYTRLWTSYLPPITAAPAAAAATATTATTAADTDGDISTITTTLLTPEATLLVHEEEQHIAAIACSGGAVALVRLPTMDIIASVASSDYNAVGETLALQWTATSPHHLLTPDVIVAAGDDDVMTSFQLLPPFLASAVGSSRHSGNDVASHLSSNESVLANGRLRILERHRFHRSWVSRLHLAPVVVPASASASAAAADGGGGAAGGGGMPQYLGVCLVATSYDHRTSFWPFMFASNDASVTLPPAQHGSRDAVARHARAEAAEALCGFADGGSIAVPAAAAAASAVLDHYVLADGPTAAYPLHTELVVGVAAAGGGTSFILTTVCCRGKVKFWSMQVKL